MTRSLTARNRRPWWRPERRALIDGLVAHFESLGWHASNTRPGAEFVLVHGRTGEALVLTVDAYVATVQPLVGVE